MLTYTFSRREKALLLALAIVLIAVVWYVLVFQHTNNEISRIDGEIAQVQTDTTIANAQLAEKQRMEATIARYQSEGAKAVEIPNYDNLQPLMSELNAIMSAADTYTLTFADLDREAAPGYVLRSARIDYGCESYEAAEEIVDAVSTGTYPCSVDTVSITDNTVARVSGSRARSSTNSSNIGASLYVTFFEKDGAGKSAAARAKSESASS